jgi:hypothetical protein
MFTGGEYKVLGFARAKPLSAFPEARQRRQCIAVQWKRTLRPVSSLDIAVGE